MDTAALITQIANGRVIALVPEPHPPEHVPRSDVLGKRWYSMHEVADMLGFGLCKVKTLVITGELRSIKDGKYRRILPEWVDEYIARRVKRRTRDRQTRAAEWGRFHLRLSQRIRRIRVGQQTRRQT